MHEGDRGPLSGLSRSTLRLHLIRLNVKFEANSRKSPNNENSQQSQQLNQLAYKFTCKTTLKVDTAAKELKALHAEIKAVEKHCPSSTIDNMTPNELVQLVVKTHLQYLDEMEDWEKQLMALHPEWECTVEVLLLALKTLSKSESRDMHSATQSKANIPISKPQASKENDSVDEAEASVIDDSHGNARRSFSDRE
jgi:hypothetical protein